MIYLSLSGFLTDLETKGGSCWKRTEKNNKKNCSLYYDIKFEKNFCVFIWITILLSCPQMHTNIDFFLLKEKKMLGKSQHPIQFVVCFQFLRSHNIEVKKTFPITKDV